jgi:F-type H+-transporting ATPase subunit c
MRKTTMILFALLAMMMMAMPAFAQGGGAAPSNHADYVAIAAGFGIAIAAGMAGLGQGKVGRPAIQLALILGLAFIESLVLFTLVIIFAKVV